MNLLEETRRLVNAARDQGLTLPQIAEAAGKPVEYDWLVKWNYGGIPDPSVTRIQALHDGLKRVLRSRKTKKTM